MYSFHATTSLIMLQSAFFESSLLCLCLVQQFQRQLCFWFIFTPLVALRLDRCIVKSHTDFLSTGLTKSHTIAWAIVSVINTVCVMCSVMYSFNPLRAQSFFVLYFWVLMDLVSFSSNGCPLGRYFVAEHQSNPTGSVRCIYRCQYRFLDAERSISYRCGDNCEDWYPHAEDELHFCHHRKECLGIDKIASDVQLSICVDHLSSQKVNQSQSTDARCTKALRQTMVGNCSLSCFTLDVVLFFLSVTALRLL